MKKGVVISMAYRSSSDPEWSRAFGARWQEASRIRATILRQYRKPDSRVVDLNNDAVLTLLEFEPPSSADGEDLIGGLDDLPSDPEQWN